MGATEARLMWERRIAMGRIKQRMIREADADAIDNAELVAVLTNRVNRLQKENALLRTKIKRQDGRPSWRPNLLACADYVAGLHLYADEDAPTTAA